MTAERKQELFDLTLRAMRASLDGHQVGLFLRLMIAESMARSINDPEVMAVQEEIAIAVAREAGVPEQEISAMVETLHQHDGHESESLN